MQRFDYDFSGLLLARRFEGVTGGTRTLGYDYWPDGALKKKQLADGVWTGNHAYDLAGRLASIGNGSGTDWSTFTYNGRSQVKKIVYGNNVSTWFNYNDSRGFLTSLETRDGPYAPTAPLLLGLDYTRNDAGMIMSVAASGGSTAQNNARSWNYTYDSVGQLLTADRQDAAGIEFTYAYDDASNMIKNTALCGGTGLSYPTAGPTALRPHAPNLMCGNSPSYDGNGDYGDSAFNLQAHVIPNKAGFRLSPE